MATKQNPKVRVFIMIPNHWAIGPTTEDAMKMIRQVSGRTEKEIRKGRFFILQFPGDAKIDVNEVNGGWTASVAPTALLDSNMPKEDTDRLRALVAQ